LHGLKSFIAVIFLGLTCLSTVHARSGPVVADTGKQVRLWNEKEAAGFYTGTGLVFAGSMAVLYYAWYRHDNAGRFRFFNDLNAWRGMDKMGHFTSTWWACQWVYEASQPLNIPARQKLILSIGIPVLFMSTVEVFDGFSQGYGFSVPDMVANGVGASLFFVQQHFWQRQDFVIKASFHENHLYKLRPELLGAGVPETWLKNYNGQTIWMSYPLNKLIPVNTAIPDWLCLSAGIGAGGLLGSESNTWSSKGQLVSYNQVQRYSRYLLSFDIDLCKLPLKGRFWSMFTSTFRWVKLPFPAIEYSGIRKWQVHPFYW